MAETVADTVAGLTANRIESLLSARLFLEPQLADDRLYFVSSLSGHLSLYAMDAAGGVPEPLLPPQIALQNPKLVDALEENDDVQDVYANFDIPERMLEAVAS